MSYGNDFNTIGCDSIDELKRKPLSSSLCLFNGIEMENDEQARNQRLRIFRRASLQDNACEGDESRSFS
jgi:hypothetical protein